jgi:hypothetical protein
MGKNKNRGVSYRGIAYFFVFFVFWVGAWKKKKTLLVKTWIKRFLGS